MLGRPFDSFGELIATTRAEQMFRESSVLARNRQSACQPCLLPTRDA
jgi:hypothetical protein